MGHNYNESFFNDGYRGCRPCRVDKGCCRLGCNDNGIAPLDNSIYGNNVSAAANNAVNNAVNNGVNNAVNNALNGNNGNYGLDGNNGNNGNNGCGCGCKPTCRRIPREYPGCGCRRLPGVAAAKLAKSLGYNFGRRTGWQFADKKFDTGAYGSWT